MDHVDPVLSDGIVESAVQLRPCGECSDPTSSIEIAVAKRDDTGVGHVGECCQVCAEI